FLQHVQGQLQLVVIQVVFKGIDLILADALGGLGEMCSCVTEKGRCTLPRLQKLVIRVHMCETVSSGAGNTRDFALALVLPIIAPVGGGSVPASEGGRAAMARGERNRPGCAPAALIVLTPLLPTAPAAETSVIPVEFVPQGPAPIVEIEEG